MKRSVWLGLMTLALVACEDDKSTKGGEPTPTGTVAAADEPEELTDEELDSAEIPVEEDFEEEAREAISADNLESEVSKLESEITGGE